MFSTVRGIHFRLFIFTKPNASVRLLAGFEFLAADDLEIVCRCKFQFNFLTIVLRILFNDAAASFVIATLPFLFCVERPQLSMEQSQLVGEGTLPVT